MMAACQCRRRNNTIAAARYARRIADAFRGRRDLCALWYYIVGPKHNFQPICNEILRVVRFITFGRKTFGARTTTTTRRVHTLHSHPSLQPRYLWKVRDQACVLLHRLSTTRTRLIAFERRRLVARCRFGNDFDTVVITLLYVLLHVPLGLLVFLIIYNQIIIKNAQKTKNTSDW